MRGLLHDLGHEIATLSYLIEAVRGDARIPGDSAFRLELLALEISRLLEIISDGLDEAPAAGRADPAGQVELRELASELTQLAGFGHEATIGLLPGERVWTRVNPAQLWRVLSNVIDNAARAAGPGGRVRVAVGRSDIERSPEAPGAEARAFIEIADDGPGFGNGPPGLARLGLSVVVSLLETLGGTARVDAPQEGGTRIRITLPLAAAVPAGGPVPARAAGPAGAAVRAGQGS